MRGWVALGLLLVLPGCAQPAPEPAPVEYRTMERPVNVAAPKPVCLAFAGDSPLVGIGAQPPSRPYAAFSVYDAAAQLEVPEDATAIVLDLWWDQGATTGVRSQVTDPDGNVVITATQPTATSEAPVRLRFDDPKPGSWSWRGVADPAAVGVVVHFHEGLYYESPDALELMCNEHRPSRGR